MKILCVCRMGDSRSVALAYLLKHEHRQDAIAMGIRSSRRSTRDMLYRWADRILLTDQKYAPEIPEPFRPKVRIFHVGTDRWFRGFAEDLLSMFRRYLAEGGVQ